MKNIMMNIESQIVYDYDGVPVNDLVAFTALEQKARPKLKDLRDKYGDCGRCKSNICEGCRFYG